MVGLGIITYNRPQYFKQCIDAVIEHLSDKVDVIFVYNDGSDHKYDVAYNEIYKTLPDKVKVEHELKNKGVAAAKNWCLKQMMDAGCDWLFLMEDDIIVKSPDVLDMYMATALDTGINHLSFAHHGEGNASGPKNKASTINFYDAAVGAFCLYTRDAINEVGYFDEGFTNAMEHIEHTFRLARAGYHPSLYLGYADFALSKNYLEEIPGSIEKSSIRVRKDWRENIIKSLEHWKAKDPEWFPFEKQLEFVKAGGEIA